MPLIYSQTNSASKIESYIKHFTPPTVHQLCHTEVLSPWYHLGVPRSIRPNETLQVKFSMGFGLLNHLGDFENVAQ